MAIYNRCFIGLFYIILLILPTHTFSAEYYKTTLKQVNGTQLDAVGRRTDFSTKQNLDNIIKKATLSLSSHTMLPIIGASMKQRIFLNTSKGGQFSATGVSEITSLLTSFDYIIDYDMKEIYKLKRTDDLNCKNFGYKWKTSTVQYNCPKDAADRAASNRCTSQPNISNCQVVKLCTDSTCTTEISILPSNANIGQIYVELSAIYTPTGTTIDLGDQIYRGEKLEPSESEKILLGDSQLAQLMLGMTHERNYSWTSVKEIFTAENEYEITHNHAYVVLEKALIGSSNTVSDDSSIKPDKDENGNSTGGFNLPSFCDWAKPVCDLISWVKEEVTGETDTKVDIQQSDISSNHYYDKTYFSYEGSCPANYSFNFEILGTSSTIEFDYSLLCLYLSKFSNYLIFISYIAAAFIISGVRNA